MRADYGRENTKKGPNFKKLFAIFKKIHICD